MVSFSRLAIALSAIAGSFASPAASPVKRDITERGPHDFILQRNSSGLSRRQSSPNYNQDYTTGGTVSYTPNGGSFSVNWNTQDDFVVGVGWTTGTTNPITFNGNFDYGSGTALLSVYGWTENPLVEYYIIETNHDFSSGGTQKGTLTSDGSTYVVWENERVSEPSIVGTATFEQYISIRSSQRSSGTVTVENHFKAWAALGLNLGTMNYQVIAVEGWGGSGSAQQTISNTGTGTGTGGGGGGGTTTSPVTTPTGGSGACSALYGQCGGIGWTGASCCSSGTCQVGNSYYSQCL